MSASRLAQLDAAWQSFARAQSGAAAIEDLQELCCASTSAWHADPRVHAYNEGKRAVWLYIQERMKGVPQSVIDQIAREQSGDDDV